MHTATQLFSASFDCSVAGRPAPSTALFPGWDPGDRFGIVVDRPLGMLGASLLVEAAIAAFYDARPHRRDRVAVYPEVYAFHVGRPMGDHSAFDFWPPRKELILPSEPLDVLAAINAHAITRLALPAGTDGDVTRLAEGPSTWAEQQSARDRITSCFLYDVDGEMSSADVSLSSVDPRVEENAATTLDIAEVAQAVLESGQAVTADTLRWVEQVRARAAEVPDVVRQELRAARRTATGEPVLRIEHYRRISVDDALGRIAGLG